MQQAAEVWKLLCARDPRQAARRLVALLILSSLLTFAIAFKIAQSTALNLDLGKIATQGEAVEGAFKPLLAMTLPLDKFVGFCNVIRPLKKSEPAIGGIYFFDADGVHIPLCDEQPPPEVLATGPWSDLGMGASIKGVERVAEADGVLRLDLPVYDKLGNRAGAVVLYSLQAQFTNRLIPVFGPAGLALVLVLLGCGLFLTQMASPGLYTRRVDSFVAFAAPYAVVLLISVTAVYVVLANNAADRAEAFAKVIGARLFEAISLGLDPADFGALDRMIEDYRTNNPEIGYIALIEGNAVLQYSGPGEWPARWEFPSGHYGYVTEIRPRQILAPQFRVAVGVPREVVVNNVLGFLRVLAPTGLAVLVVAGGMSLAGVIRWRVSNSPPGAAALSQNVP